MCPVVMTLSLWLKVTLKVRLKGISLSLETPWFITALLTEVIPAGQNQGSGSWSMPSQCLWKVHFVLPQDSWCGVTRHTEDQEVGLQLSSPDYSEAIPLLALGGTWNPTRAALIHRSMWNDSGLQGLSSSFSNKDMSFASSHWKTVDCSCLLSPRT